MKNIHWPAVGSLGMSVLGLVALNSQTIAQVVPPQFAGAVLGAGLIAQFVVESGAKKAPVATPPTA